MNIVYGNYTIKLISEREGIFGEKLALMCGKKDWVPAFAGIRGRVCFIRGCLRRIRREVRQARRGRIGIGWIGTSRRRSAGRRLPGATLRAGRRAALRHRRYLRAERAAFLSVWHRHKRMGRLLPATACIKAVCADRLCRAFPLRRDTAERVSDRRRNSASPLSWNGEGSEV